MRHLAVIADSGVERQLARFMRSVRLQEWNGLVRVYHPAKDKPSLPSGCQGVAVEEWWDRDTSILEVPNLAALIKPTIFLDDYYTRHDQVLYMDCADTLVLCPLEQIFDAAGGACLSARIHREGPIVEKVPDDFPVDIDDRYTGYDVIPNNGVIVAQLTASVWGIMEEWREILEHYPESGGWYPKHNIKLGDQISFAYLWRKYTERGLTGELPAAYNYNRGNRMTALKVKGNRVYTPQGERVYVPHASGSYGLPNKLTQLLGEKPQKKNGPTIIRQSDNATATASEKRNASFRRVE